MATLNLGRIKPVFRGAYNNSTAYVVDDIVTSGGSSYICIQASTGNAVSNSTYWSVMASGGTDVTTTLTTQGDMLYRDGSGLQRLAKGTAGQALKMNSSANAPEWGTAGGSNTPAWYVSKSAVQSISNNTNTTITFDTEGVDTDNAFASNQFTVPSGSAGIYYMFAQMRIDTANDFDSAILKINVNGSNIAASWGRNEYYDHYNVQAIKSLSVGDVVKVDALQNSGGTKNIGHIDQGDVTFFGGFKLI